MKYIQPDDKFRELFEVVQMSGIFPDSKTFVDAIPKDDAENIINAFYTAILEPGFELKEFVLKYFQMPIPQDNEQLTIREESLSERLNRQWDLLRRVPDSALDGGSIIPLPNPYIVPGGRFQEIYYWDSYFTMLGLVESGKLDMVHSMVENFAFLIREVGHIPNGNRTYFLSRSQPPFFCQMVDLLAKAKGDPQIRRSYWPEMVMEYEFWMDGTRQLQMPGKYAKRVIRMDDDALLNRYWDDRNNPRPESFVEDVELAESSRRYSSKIYRSIRAACESGWDFSSRWLYDPTELNSIQTVAIIPVDLNVLLFQLERSILKYMPSGTSEDFKKKIRQRYINRKEAIERYHWNEEQGIYLDYHLKFKEQVQRPSLAMLFPLYANIATQLQAEKVLSYVEKQFLKPGGLVTTALHTGQQWDAPNGWAPLQWIGFKAMLNYGQTGLARTLAERWTKLNEQVFERTGKMMEKYNVEDLSLEAGGGEYPVQDGFGWTNGVYLAMKSWLNSNLPG
jgi:alpha,alpha-trehalase